jgi:hypothetical protein
MNKTLIALSAAALFGSFTAALAYEAPEDKIGDRYPLLEQTYAPTAVKTFGRTAMPRAWHSQTTAAEVSENKIGDRYPALEQVYQPVAAAKVAVRNVAHRLAMFGTEAQENKIGDRYPFLEQVYASKNASNGRVMAARTNKSKQGI